MSVILGYIGGHSLENIVVVGGRGVYCGSFSPRDCLFQMRMFWGVEEEFLEGCIFPGGMVLLGLEYHYPKSLWVNIS